MIDSDRLDELATWRPDDDCPDDAKIRIPAGDLRDLVALIPVARAAARLVKAREEYEDIDEAENALICEVLR